MVLVLTTLTGIPTTSHKTFCMWSGFTHHSNQPYHTRPFFMWSGSTHHSTQPHPTRPSVCSKASHTTQPNHITQDLLYVIKLPTPLNPTVSHKTFCMWSSFTHHSTIWFALLKHVKAPGTCWVHTSRLNIKIPGFFQGS